MEILIDAEIEDIMGSIILNGNEKFIQPASYDIRVGNEIYLPERGKRIELTEGEIEYLQPFESILIRTLEEFIIPPNMSCLVQPSSKLSTRGLIYTGGAIDPGYEGYLWINLRNMAPMHEEIEYGQPIASIQFIKLKDNVKNAYVKKYGRIKILPKERRPHKPERTLYDWIDISKKLDSVSSSVDNLKNLVFYVFYAAIAGIFAGVAVVTFQFILNNIIVNN